MTLQPYMHACMHLLLYEKEKLAPERMALCVCRVLWLQVRHMHDMHHFENSFCRLWPRAHPKRWAAQGCTVIDPELCQEILRSPIYEKCALVYSKLGVVSSWR